MTKTKPYPAYKDSGVEWLQAVPEHWTLSRFGLEMSINAGQVDPSEEHWAEAWLVAPNHIESGTGRILGKETASEQGADSGKYVAREGQILYSKIRPALNKVAITEEDCLCSADIYAMSSIRGDDHRYLAYYMLAAPFHAYASEMSGRVKMPKINREELSAAPWLLPPLDEQRQIAAFLDRETVKIDELIGKQEQLIERLVERRRSFIDDRLIGLSGEHVRLRFLYRQSGEADSADEEVLSVYRDFGVIPKASRSDNYNRTPENLDRYLLVRPGDLVVNKMKAWQGSLGVSAYRGIVSPDYEVLRLTSNRFLPEFIHYLLRSPALIGEYGMRSVGIRPAQWRLYWDQLACVEVVIPGMEIQRQVAESISTETAKIDALIEKAQRFIDLSRERRSALISAVVTGQIDVREARAS